MNIGQPVSLELLHRVTRDLTDRMKALRELRQQVLLAETEMPQSTPQPLGLAEAA